MVSLYLSVYIEGSKNVFELTAADSLKSEHIYLIESGFSVKRVK